MKHPTPDEWRQYLTNYCAAELQGAEFIEDLDSFAPSDKEREWLRIWAAEEHNHHKIWAKTLKRKNVNAQPLKGALKTIYDVAYTFVRNRNWAGSMVAASVIEHTSNATAQHLYPYADSDVKAVFRKITGDDLGHLNFDVQQIGLMAKTKKGRQAVYQAHQDFITAAREWPKRNDILDSELVVMNDAYALHRLALKRVGVNIPRVHFTKSWIMGLQALTLTLIFSVRKAM